MQSGYCQETDTTVAAVLPAVGGNPIGEQGAVVTWTVTLINGDTPVGAGNLSLVVNSTDAAYAAASITCTPAITQGLAASSVMQCSFPVTVTAAHVQATEMPAFTVRAVDAAGGGGYPLEHVQPALKVYTVASMSADAPVITSSATTYINGELLNGCHHRRCMIHLPHQMKCSLERAVVMSCVTPSAAAGDRAVDDYFLLPAVTVQSMVSTWQGLALPLHTRSP
jgi:hypothetical protein